MVSTLSMVISVPTHTDSLTHMEMLAMTTVPTDTDTQWWSFMHNMWNHVQDSHRFFKRNKNSRNWKYPGKAGYDVTSNLAMTTHDGSSFLGGRYDHSQHT